MTTWKPEHLSERVPLYVALADALEHDIRDGRLRPGERLPTHRALARDLSVNVMTVTRGYAEAARRGLVEGEIGRGTFVRTGLPQVETFQDPGSEGPYVDFHFNVPWGDPALLDAGPWLAEAQRDPAHLGLDAGYVASGLPNHREAAAQLAAHGVEAAPPVERVLLTAGVQHAMTLTLASLCAPGDSLLVEDLTYPGLRSLAGVLHLRPVPVPCDVHGPDPDALRTLARRTEARVTYLMPTVHNPTGRVMPTERREALARVAREEGLYVLEDEAYGYALERPPLSLATYAPERTFRLIGTSKSLASGLRVGACVVPESTEPWVERLCATVAATAWMVAPATADLMTSWVERGLHLEVSAFKRREAAARRELLAAQFPRARVAGPSGAPHVWFELPEPWSAEELTRAARRAGVAVTPGSAFRPGRGEASPAVRLALGTPRSREEVGRGLAILARVLERTPDPVV